MNTFGNGQGWLLKMQDTWAPHSHVCKSEEVTLTIAPTT